MILQLIKVTLFIMVYKKAPQKDCYTLGYLLRVYKMESVSVGGRRSGASANEALDDKCKQISVIVSVNRRLSDCFDLFRCNQCWKILQFYTSEVKRPRVTITVRYSRSCSRSVVHILGTWIHKALHNLSSQCFYGSRVALSDDDR